MATNSLNLAADFKPVLDSVNNLIKALDKLEKKLDSIAKGPSVFQKLFTNSAEFDQFVNSISKLDDIRIGNFSKLAQSLKELSFATKSLSTGPGTLIKDFVESINSLQTIQLPSTKGNNTGFAAQLKSIFDVGLLGTLRKAPPKDSFKEFFNFFKFVSDSLAAIANQTVSEKGIENVRFLSSALLRFISVTDESFKALETSSLFQKRTLIQRLFNTSQFSPLFDFLRFISRNIAQIANITASDKGLDNIRRLSGSLLNIAKAVPNILDAAAALPGNVFSLVERVKRFLQLQKLFALISFVARNISGIANKIGNTSGLDNLKQLSGALFKISIAVPDIIDAARAIPGSLFSVVQRVKRLVQLRKLFGIIRDVTRGLSGISGSIKADKINNVTNALNLVVQFSKIAIGKEINFKQIDLSGFQQFAKNLALGLAELNRVKFTGSGGFINAFQQLTNLNFNNLKAMPDIGNSFTKIFSSSRLFTVAQNSGENFGERFRIGFSERLGAALGESVFSAFRSLDPRKISLDRILRTDAFQDARGFDKLSSQLQVFGRLSDDALKRAQAFSNEIGIKYPLSANDALEATLKLVKAGQDLNQVEFILPSAADLAALSDSGDLDLVTNTLIGAERAFAEFSEGVEGSFENIAKAADIISAGSDVSTASVESLSEGLADVSRSAADAGLTLEETVATLATLDEAQLKGSEGGRGLRAALNAIFKDKSQEKFKELGISIFDADGNVRRFNDILLDLQTRFKGLTQQQIIETLGDISDTFGRTALSALIMNGGIGETLVQMQDVGTAADRAGKLLDNFDGDVEQLQGSIETLNTKALLPFIQQFARPIVQLLRVIVDGFNNLPQPVLDVVTHVGFLISTFATFAAGNLLVIRVLGKLTLVVGGLVSGFTALILNLPALVAGFGLFITTIGALSISLTGILAVLTGVSVAIVSTFKVIKDNVGGAGDTFSALKSTVGEVFTEIGLIISEIASTVNAVFGRQAQSLYTTFGTKVGNTFSTLNFRLKSFLNTLKQVNLLAQGVGDVLTLDRSSIQATSKYFNTLKKIADLDIAKRIFGDDVSVKQLDKFFKNTIATLNELKRAFGDVGRGLVDLLFNFDEGKIQLRRGLSSLLSIATEAISKFTGLNLSDAIVQFNRQNITKGINSLIGSVAAALRAFVTKNKEKFIDLGSQLFNFFFVKIRGVGLGAASFILRLLGLDNIADALTEVEKVITDTFGDIINFVIDILAGDINSPEKLATRLRDLIKDAFARLPELIKSIGISLDLSQLVDFGDMLQSSEAFEKLVDAIGKIVSYPLDSISQVLDNIGQAFELIVENKEAAVVVTSVGAALGLIIQRQAVIGILSKISSAFLSIALPITAFVAVTELLKNLDDFSKGNVGKGVSDTLFGITETLTSFVGLDFPADKTRQAVETTLNGAKLLVDQLIDNIKTGIQNVFDGLIVEATRTAARFQVVFGVAQEGFGVDFSKIDASLEGGLDTQNLDKIADVLTSPANLGLVQAQLRTAFTQIFKTFADADLPALARENSPDFGNIVRILINAGGFSEALDSVARETPEFLNEFLQKAFEVAPEDLAALDVNTVLEELRSKLFSADPGGLNVNVLGDIVSEFYRGGIISLEEGEAFITDARAEAERLKGVFGELTSAPADAIRENLPDLNVTLDELESTLLDADPFKFFDRFTDTERTEAIKDVFGKLFGDRPLEDQKAGLKAIADLFGNELTKGIELTANAAELAQVNFTGLGTIFTKIGDNILQTFANVSDKTNLFKDGLEQVATLAENLKLTGLSDFLRDRAAALKDFSGFTAPAIESGVVSNDDNTEQLEANVLATDDYTDSLEEEADTKNKIRDFNIAEARKAFDDLQEELKAAKKIDEINQEFRDEEAENLEKFNLDQQRQEEDHRNKLFEIAKTGDNAFNDAIAGRDASAAQAAQEQLREQRSNEKKEFELKQKRDIEDFEIEKQKQIAERNQKLADAKQDLADLIAKNALERARRLEDHNTEINDIIAKNQAKQAIQQSANQVEQAQQVNQNAVLEGLVGLGMTAFNAVVQGKLGETAQVGLGILGVLVNGFLNTQQQLIDNYTNAVPGSPDPRGVVPTRRARGGPVYGGKLYEVADPDSELFKVGNKTYLIPGQSGAIIPPNRRMVGAGGNISIGFDFGGFEIHSPNGNAEQIAAEIEKRVVRKITEGVKRAISEGNR